MDTLQCFRNGDPIQCEEICNDSALLLFFVYLFGIITIGLIFIILIRPVVNAFYKITCCVRKNDIIENIVSSETETQETQCDLDIGMQRVVIHPDHTLQLSGSHVTVIRN